MNELGVANKIALDDFAWFLREEVAKLPSPTLSQKLTSLTREVNVELCSSAYLVQLESGEWSLRWRERHPEMISAEEFFPPGETLLEEEKKRQEWSALNKAMPGKYFEIPITRQQAFALYFTCCSFIPNEAFEKEHGEMLDTVCGSV